MSHCCENHESIEEHEVQEDSEDIADITPFVKETHDKKSLAKNPWLPISLILIGALIFNQFYTIEIYRKQDTSSNREVQSNSTVSNTSINSDTLAAAVLPQDGVTLPISWRNLGEKMTEQGVIDEAKFKDLFQNSLTEDQEAILAGTWNKPIIMTNNNSRFMLDMLWAFGLANQNDILDNGEMSDEQYGGAGRFASTGGWSLAEGEPMDHYSKHQFVTLSAEQQKLVDEVSGNIYRPCCGNSTHFPDCNHGMAMLGLLQLMAAEGVSEQDMYDIALKVNSFWFPQTYIDLARYFEEQGQKWDTVDTKLALSKEYSSAQGYSTTRSKIQSLPQSTQGSSSC